MVCPSEGLWRRRARHYFAVAACGLLMALSARPVLAAAEDPLVLVRSIAALGPRVPGTEANAAAARLLLSAMEAAGLEQVGEQVIAGDPPLRLLEGVLPGESGLEILLAAHYDTVPESPGAADDAAGCAVVVAAAAGLADLPRRHGVRVLLFDGEENQLAGSSGWVESLSPEHRAAILAAVNIDLVGWNAARRGTVLAVVAERGSRRRMAPGWLVSAALDAGRSVDAPLAVAVPTGGPIGQILMRSLDLVWMSDAEALLAGGVPAVTLSDADLFRSDPANHGRGDTADRLSAAALAAWTDRLAALVRRLDQLGGRPRDDDQFLALFGRVWPRRSLYWFGLVVWVVLVFQGLPGAWRGAVATERRRQGRTYLPGFAVRFLFLGSLLMLPVFTVVLLLPAAILHLLPARWRLTPRWKLALASLPMLLVLVGSVVMTTQGMVAGMVLGLPAVALLATTFGALLWVLAVEVNSSGLDHGA